MDLSNLGSKKNLELAWQRISTGLNHQYKKYFREQYGIYEIALSDHISNLSIAIKTRSYEPSKPTRIYIPKPSGLQRPITLLTLEDQIVLQAIANLYAKKCQVSRQQVQDKKTYSNYIEDTQSIFLFRNWRKSYQKY
ncbi:MAG: hypothetical protein AB8G05_10120 [Oligoflexales bacterium]